MLILRRTTVSLLVGLAVVASGPLFVVPVLADEPGEDLPSIPSSEPALTPSPSLSPTPPTPSASPTVDPSPTPVSTPTMGPSPSSTASPSVPGDEPARVRVHPDNGSSGQRPIPQVGQTVPVAAVDDEFRPTPVTVTVGTTVVWTNDGQNPHTVTANDRAFDSGTLEPGQTYSVTFDQVGQVPYYCQIHGEPGSGMTGLVIVQAAPEEEEGVSPSPGSGGLPATGVDPIPLAIAALLLATLGLAALRASRRATDEGGDGLHPGTRQ